jgi:hypothetical protein
MAIRESYSAPVVPGSGGGNPLVTSMPGPVPSHTLYPQARQRGAPQDYTVRGDPAPSADDAYAEINSDRRRNKTPPPVYFGPEGPPVDTGLQLAEQAAQIADLRAQVADLVATLVPGKVGTKPGAELATLRRAVDELRAEVKLLREAAGTGSCANCGSSTT